MSSLTLDVFQDKVKQYWRKNIKNKDQVEVSLNIIKETNGPVNYSSVNPDHREFLKMFQAFMAIKTRGTQLAKSFWTNNKPCQIICPNCKQLWHTTDKCWAPGGGMAGMRPPIKSIRCRKCGEMGQYSTQCKKPRAFIHQANEFYDQYYDQQLYSYYQEDKDDDANFELMFVATFDLHSTTNTNSYEWCKSKKSNKAHSNQSIQSSFNEEHVGSFYQLLAEDEDKDGDVSPVLWDMNEVTRTGYVSDSLFNKQEEQEEHKEQEEVGEIAIKESEQDQETFSSIQ